MAVCKICNTECKRNNNLSYHIKIKHNLNYLDYVITYENFIKPKCLVCGKDAKYRGHGLMFSSICGNKECKKTKIKVNYKEETREKIRKARFNYLNKKLGKTAWDRRINGEMSYLEQWFFDNIILKNNLLSRYDIVNEYPCYPYFIDFAFINIKLAVELDGKQHFRNIKNQNRDIKKQKDLIDKGWKIYRIRFNELTQEKIIDFLKVLDNVEIYETKVLECRLYKFTEYKHKSHQTRQEYYKKRKEIYNERESKKIIILKNSGIDFKKYGWVTLAAKVLKKHPQKIYKWMKRFCPELYETAHKSVQALKSEHRYVKTIKQKKPIAFHKLEKELFTRGYIFDENNKVNHKGKILKPNVDRNGYYCINIKFKNTIKHIKVHRLKAYFLYGENIYKEGVKVCFKNNDKTNWSNENIILKEVLPQGNENFTALSSNGPG